MIFKMAGWLQAIIINVSSSYIILDIAYQPVLDRVKMRDNTMTKFY